MCLLSVFENTDNPSTLELESTNYLQYLLSFTLKISCSLIQLFPFCSAYLAPVLLIIKFTGGMIVNHFVSLFVNRIRPFLIYMARSFVTK